jgi:hypothetical protein
VRKQSDSGRIGYWILGGGGLGVFLVFFAMMFWPSPTDSAAPGMLARLTNNQILVTITNGSSTNFYELLSKQDLNPAVPWMGGIIGTNGQTNFLFDLGPLYYTFYWARDCHDCDNDGVLNWQDADYANTNIGILTITIDSPANGATVE